MKFIDVIEQSWEEDAEGKPITFLEGETRGCGCCADRRKLNAEDLTTHIRELKEKTKNAQKLLKKYF